MYQAYKDYIETGSRINKKFTKVLIDGRARPQCARYMHNFIDENCIVFLHDWSKSMDRPHYYSVLERYSVIKEILGYPGIVALKKKVAE